MTVGDHINIHGSIISYNIVKDKIKFKYTWVHKNDQNVLYALSSNYLSDKRRGKIRQTWGWPSARPFRKRSMSAIFSLYITLSLCYSAMWYVTVRLVLTWSPPPVFLLPRRFATIVPSAGCATHHAPVRAHPNRPLVIAEVPGRPGVSKGCHGCARQDQHPHGG